MTGRRLATLIRTAVSGKAVAAYAVAVAAPLLLASPAFAASPGAIRSVIANGHIEGTPHATCATSGGISCLAEKLDTGMKPATGVTPSTAVSGYGPADLKAAYALPDSSTTTTVAIVNAYGDTTLESDLATYRSHFGLPECTLANGCLTIVNQYGQTSPLPAHNAGWAAETSLDVDMVSATCPTCHILVVQANNANEDGNPNLEDAVNTAVSMGAKFVSMSWGGAEGPYDAYYNDYAFNHPGVVMVAASGDNGFEVNWPASVPSVVSVGGTSLTRTNTLARGFDERVWGSNYGATGSGCSTVQTQPWWQNISSITSVCSNRALNDVSVVADPNTGVAVVQNGVWQVMGGTSAGSPMIAAMYAMAGPASSSVPAPAYPYLHRSSFLDITSGATNCTTQNALCVGTAGWDGPTGVGVPQGVGGFSSADVTTVATHTVTVRNPGNIHSYLGSSVAIDASALDSAGLAVTYQASGLPTGTWINSNGIIFGRPQRAGTYTVSVTATDQAGVSGTASFAWVVRSHRFVPTSRPRVAGTIKSGSRVSVYYGSFRQDSTVGQLLKPTLYYRWYVDGRLTTATGSTLVLPTRWRGHLVSAKIYTSAPNFTSYVYVTAAVRVQ